MVRLLGKIAEKQILPTHDTILKHGYTVLGGAGEGIYGGYVTITTGFSSVKDAWLMLKRAAASAAATAAGLSFATSGGKLEITLPNNATLQTGWATVYWWAIGD